MAWHSRKQSCLALSTTEDEYYAVSCVIEKMLTLSGVTSEFENWNKKEINDHTMTDLWKFMIKKCCDQKFNVFLSSTTALRYP